MTKPCTFCGDTDGCCPCNDPCEDCGEAEALCRCVHLCDVCNLLLVANVEMQPCKGLQCRSLRWERASDKFWLDDRL